MNNSLKTLLVASLLGGLVAAHAAGSDSANFEVRIEITEACDIAQGSNIDFTSYARGTTAGADASGTLLLTCTLGTTYNIELSAGQSFDAGSRQMKNGTNVVPYALYQNAARTVPWGTGTDKLTDTASTSGQVTLNVYARVPGTSNVPAGTYTDIVTATVNY